MGADLLIWHFDWKQGRTIKEDDKGFRAEVDATRGRIERLAPSWGAMQEVFGDDGDFAEPVDFELNRGTAAMVAVLLKAQDKFKELLREDLETVVKAHNEEWRGQFIISVGRWSIMTAGGISYGDYPDEDFGGLCEALDHLERAGVLKHR